MQSSVMGPPLYIERTHPQSQRTPSFLDTSGSSPLSVSLYIPVLLFPLPYQPCGAHRLSLHTSGGRRLPDGCLLAMRNRLRFSSIAAINLVSLSLYPHLPLEVPPLVPLLHHANYHFIEVFVVILRRNPTSTDRDQIRYEII